MTAAVIIHDIDDVWHPFSELAHEASVRAGIVPEGMENPWEWAPFDTYGCTDQEWFDALSAATPSGDLHMSVPSDEDLTAFDRLTALGCQQHFVTARGFMDNPGVIRDLTLTWVDEWFAGRYGELIFTQDKGAAAKQLMLHHVPTFGIDDHLRNYYSLSAVGVKTYLMNKPWNHHEPILDDFRVNSLSEFAAAIEKEITV